MSHKSDRFHKEFSGEFGAHWKAEAERQVARLVKAYEDGELVVEGDGAAKWARGSYLMSDAVAALTHSGVSFDPEATERRRAEEAGAFLASYRPAPLTAEERHELRAAFGDEPVVDVLTGQRVV